MTSQSDSESAEPISAIAASTVAIALVCAAQFVLQLDFSIVNVALPTIQRDLKMPAAQLQWIVTGYALTFGSLLLVGGRLADVVGRRLLLRVGLVGFALASLVCGISRWPAMLIAARIVQGSTGAMVSPAALSLLTTMSPEGPQRSRALAIWQATTAAGAMAGILAGGLLTQYLGWRAIFLVNPPLILVLLALSSALPKDVSRTARSLDVRGAALISTSVAALIFGLSNGQQRGFTSGVTIAALVLAAVCLVAFVHTERIRPQPMVPKGFFSSVTRRTAASAMLMIGAILAGYVYFTSLYLQRVQHFSPVETGLALLPSTVAVVLTSTLLTRRLLTRFSVKAVLLIALAFIAAGQFLLARISMGGFNYVSTILPGILLTGLGVGLGLPTSSIAITSGVEKRDQGIAGAVFTTSQQTGAAVGLAILATLAASRTVHSGGSLVAGYRIAFVIAGLIGVAAWAYVALRLNTRSCQQELDRQRPHKGVAPPMTSAEACLRRA